MGITYQDRASFCPNPKEEMIEDLAGLLRDLPPSIFRDFFELLSISLDKILAEAEPPEQSL